MHTQNERAAGIVWLVSAGALLTYGVLGLLLDVLPGIEQLVSFLENLQGNHIYIAAFFTILIEGLYVIGNFFPGSSTVLILAVLSQLGGTTQFLLTIFAIFIGWIIAGAVNILLAHYWLHRTNIEIDSPVSDNVWTTWFPPFRASYEVAQVAEGGKPLPVFLSSLRVKVKTCILITIIAYLLPTLINVQEVSNEEGFLSLAIIAAIMIVVGVRKIHYSQESNVRE